MVFPRTFLHFFLCFANESILEVFILKILSIFDIIKPREAAMYLNEITVLKRKGDYVLAPAGSLPGTAAAYVTYRVLGNGALVEPTYVLDEATAKRNLEDRYELREAVVLN